MTVLLSWCLCGWVLLTTTVAGSERDAVQVMDWWTQDLQARDNSGSESHDGREANEMEAGDREQDKNGLQHRAWGVGCLYTSVDTPARQVLDKWYSGGWDDIVLLLSNRSLNRTTWWDEGEQRGGD